MKLSINIRLTEREEQAIYATMARLSDRERQRGASAAFSLAGITLDPIPDAIAVSGFGEIEDEPTIFTATGHEADYPLALVEAWAHWMYDRFSKV